MVKPVDLSHHYSDTAKLRQTSVLKKYYKYYATPGVINLAGGLPNESFFPFDSFDSVTASVDKFRGDKKRTRVSVPNKHDADFEQRIDIATSMQYGLAQGYPPLVSWVREFVSKVHGSPYEGGVDVQLTHGNTDGLSKVIQLFSSEWVAGKDNICDRPHILVEEFTYTTALQNIVPRGLGTVPIKLDRFGVIVEGPGGLRDTLKNWDHTNGRRPHLMYIIPTGQNPTGIVMSQERKKGVYEVCQEFDIVIIEDDPYWFIQFDYDESDYLKSLVPSFLSMDSDGRVVRLDTFSKMMAPGCRLGWITAQPEVINKINLFAEVEVSGPSGAIQAIVAQMILGPNGWTTEGFLSWCCGLAKMYKKRRNIMCQVIDKHRESLISYEKHDMVEVKRVQILDYLVPDGGMFVWLKVRFDQHRLWSIFTLQELSEALFLFLVTRPFQVIICPGNIFGGDEAIATGSALSYFRVCYAALDEEATVTATEKCVEGVHEFWDISAEEICEILRENEESLPSLF